MERLTHKKNNCWQLKKAGNAMCKEICAEHTDGCEKCPIAEAIDRLAAYENAGMMPEEVKHISAAPVREVARGQWLVWAYVPDCDTPMEIPYKVHEHTNPHCSVCKCEALLNGAENSVASNYCPNCGADMRGD